METKEITPYQRPSKNNIPEFFIWRKKKLFKLREAAKSYFSGPATKALEKPQPGFKVNLIKQVSW